MDNNKKLDDFWDLSSLVPSKNIKFGHPKSIDAVEVTAEASAISKAASESDTIIKRYIPPHSGNVELTLADKFESVEDYEPIGALIHKVTVKKYKTSYNYYGAFLSNAVEYMSVEGKCCEYTPFFSYVPMYDQMNREQLSYYFWFRENVRREIYIKTDYGYLFTYIFELLNLGNRLDVKESQRILMALWNEYHDSFPMITYKLADWICDYSLLHRLPPPVSVSSGIIQKVNSLKEFYIYLPQDDVRKCAMILMRYCSYYDYRTSKFYTPQNKALYDEHILKALIVALKYYSSDGNILSGIDYNDSMLSRDVYVGAVCTAEQKYRIDVSFCSFSRSNELRYLIGDIIKYSENRLRTYIGVKSKMTVYSVSVELRKLLDDYFDASLPQRKQGKPVAQKQEYDVLYDIPIKPLSLGDAKKIEESSWDTTKELIDAFDETYPYDEENEHKPLPVNVMSQDADTNDPFIQYRDMIVRLIGGDKNAISMFAKEKGFMSDSLVDMINELAFDIFGDQLIEDDGMGNYSVIEDYKDKFI